MQGLLGACTCSRCPSQPSRSVVPPDKLKEVAKALGAGEVSFDKFGAFTMRGQLIDQKHQPGKRDMGLDAIIVTLSTEAITLVHPKLYENGMIVLKDYFSHTKRTREILERARVAPAEGAIPLTFHDVLAWQIMKGPQRAADIAIPLARSLCRDSKGAERMACLLWKRDKKSKGYLAVTALIQRLSSKKESKTLQEDCIRVIACLGADNERIVRLARIKPLLKAFCNALQVGSVKTIDTALWLAWRMTVDDDFCARLFRNTELMKALVAVATLEEDSLPQTREENALAILANLSVQEEMCTAILERSPELLTSAALYIEVGSTRAVELGALLVGNLAFNEASAGALAEMNIAVHRLVNLMVEGGDRARELCTLALANLTCINKFVDQFLAEEGAMEVILGVQESGATGRAREAACRVVANCSVYRLQSNGVKLPQGKGKVLSEHIFKDTTLKTQDQIKQFGFQKRQTFSTPWPETKLALTGRFPEISKRSQSQMTGRLSRLSSKVSRTASGLECQIDHLTTGMPPISSASESSPKLIRVRSTDISPKQFIRRGA